MKSIILISGMSGSGKTTAVRALEDAGWFCIDNLPAPLLMKVTELGETRDQLAFVVDVREQRFLKDVPQALEEARRAGHRVEVLFLDSSDEALARRYSETRRRHPLAGSGGVLEGIAKEREALRPLRDHAEHVLDTSTLTVHELRRQITARFGGGSGGLSLTVMSFGFKYGVPSNADMVLDVRFMPNPYFVPELKALTGKDPRVASFVLDRPDAWVFLDKTYELLEFLVPRYQKEGKSYVTVAIGCTGGKHRSVAVAHALAQRLKQSNFGGTAQLWDRDVDKE
ncbi:MAG: RNase adapter RapZ [Archangium sp.]